MATRVERMPSSECLGGYWANQRGSSTNLLLMPDRRYGVASRHQRRKFRFPPPTDAVKLITEPPTDQRNKSVPALPLSPNKQLDRNSEASAVRCHVAPIISYISGTKSFSTITVYIYLEARPENKIQIIINPSPAHFTHSLSHHLTISLLSAHVFPQHDLALI
ncbi:unnamed protein product [Tuber aestivum]|uniref:Uncharacterized protein n=1 Tax=Tuber aestivum TaxID=59557 RepID=A0A292PJZ9_9PEZI|nr:unnamed protein product [Tuber aestivum]